MPLSRDHKAATRARIVASAGRVFRDAGFAAASVDAVMAGAGLTHGGFYAHFASKQDLLREVLTDDHGLIRLLARRRASSPRAWRQQTARVLRDYLHPEHLREVAAGCSFAALAGDAARAAEPVRAGYRSAWTRLVGELLRGPGEEPLAAWSAATAAQRERAAALAGMAIGAVSLARVLEPDAAGASLLRGVARLATEQLAALSIGMGASRRRRAPTPGERPRDARRSRRGGA